MQPYSRTAQHARGKQLRARHYSPPLDQVMGIDTACPSIVVAVQLNGITQSRKPNPEVGLTASPLQRVCMVPRSTQVDQWATQLRSKGRIRFSDIVHRPRCFAGGRQSSRLRSPTLWALRAGFIFVTRGLLRIDSPAPSGVVAR
jgi:hypothetical protein